MFTCANQFSEEHTSVARKPRQKRQQPVSILVGDFDLEKHLERNRRIASNKAKSIQ